MWYETILDYINEIILGLASIGIIGILGYLTSFIVKNIKPIIENIVLPLFGKLKKEATDKLTPYEKALDKVLESLAFDFETKANNPTLSEYQKEKYLGYAKDLTNLKKVEIVKEVVKYVDKGENILETVVDNIDDVKSFIDRKEN